MKKLFRISTVPISLNLLLKGQLRYLNQFYEVTAISGDGNDLRVVEEREKVTVHALEMAREISPLRDVVALYKLYRYFKKESPDIVHSITPKAGLLCMVAAKWAGVPVRMHTFTGLIFPHKRGVLKHLLICLDRFFATNATHVFPEGQGVKKDLELDRITRKPLRIIGNGNVNGIDTAYFNRNLISTASMEDLKFKLGFFANDFVFIFVGRLVKDKGINELVVAFKELAEKYSSTSAKRHPKLLLVGYMEPQRDPLLPEIMLEIERNYSIVSVGFQEDVRPYLALADAFVFPSYREGFPNVVLQSLALELPVIGSDINGCTEIITTGYNGIIVPAKEVAVLKNAMEELFSNSDLYLHLKNNTRKSILPFEQKALLAEYRIASNA